jgi:hypothetical protein
MVQSERKQLLALLSAMRASLKQAVAELARG